MPVFVPVAQCRIVIHLYYGYRMPPFGYQPTPTPVARFPGGESGEKDVSGEKDMSDAGRRL